MIMGLSSEQVPGDGYDWSQGLLKRGDEEVSKLEVPLPPQQMLRRQQQQRQAAQQQQHQRGPPLRCPRCDSTNTKFCYYNNYSRSQPRHFCKACRRHWTNGGTLRNVPVGGRRKAKRPRTSHQSSSPRSTADADGTVAGDRHELPTTQPSQQVLPPPSFGQDNIPYRRLLETPLPPTDCVNNDDTSSGYLRGPFLPLAPVLQFGGGVPTPHDTSTTTPFSSFLNFTGQNDSAAVDAGYAMSMATPWELLPPSSWSGGRSSSSTVTTSSGLTLPGSSSPSSGYWGSCWDDLTGILSPDHKHTPPLHPPPQDLRLS